MCRRIGPHLSGLQTNSSKTALLVGEGWTTTTRCVDCGDLCHKRTNVVVHAEIFAFVPRRRSPYPCRTWFFSDNLHISQRQQWNIQHWRVDHCLCYMPQAKLYDEKTHRYNHELQCQTVWFCRSRPCATPHSDRPCIMYDVAVVYVFWLPHLLDLRETWSGARFLA